MPAQLKHRPSWSVDDWDLDVTIIESGPEADRLIRMTDDGCTSTCAVLRALGLLTAVLPAQARDPTVPGRNRLARSAGHRLPLRRDRTMYQYLDAVLVRAPAWQLDSLGLPWPDLTGPDATPASWRAWLDQAWQVR